MYLIKDTTGKYLKTTVNKITFTTNKIIADTFSSQREATDYIRKRFPKKRRRFYKPIFISEVSDPVAKTKKDTSFVDESIKLDNSIKEKIEYINTTQNHITLLIQSHINPIIEKYRAQLIKYDDIILDLRHYIRDEKTKVNACRGYQIFKALQNVERKRAECKKEYQRISILKSKLEKVFTDTQEFEYEPYKYRIIQDIDKYIKDPDSYNLEGDKNENI